MSTDTDPRATTIRPGTDWRSAGTYEDIRYEVSAPPSAGIAKITIDRPEVRNAFRPRSVMEMSRAFADARDDSAGAAS